MLVHSICGGVLILRFKVFSSPGVYAWGEIARAIKAPLMGIDILDSSNIAFVSEPRAVATGSGSPAGFLKFPPDPVATARGSDTELTRIYSQRLSA